MDNPASPTHQFSSPPQMSRMPPQMSSAGDVRPQNLDGAPLQAPAQSSMPVPTSYNGLNGNGNGPRANGMGRPSPFEYSRSPPSNKNTSHVPCKFFRIGNCQAGNACPFSHNLEPRNDQPCKYFAKGNCKFGPRCALAHILPDGRRANPPQYTDASGSGQPSVSPFAEQITPNARSGVPITSPSGLLRPGQDGYGFPYKHNEISHLDISTGSPPTSNFGSPPGDSRAHLSPSIRALDAQLPASFDSQGMSHIARFGPTGSSVPSRFGFNPLTSMSPTTSTEASTAFGNLDHLARHENARPFNGRSVSNNLLASSPPNSIEDPFPRRILHSESRTAPQMIPSSLPSALVKDGDELLPRDLRDLWGPNGGRRTRSYTRGHTAEDTDEDAISQSGLGARQSTSTVGTPTESSKFGSPSNASPTSRFGQFFAQQRQRQRLDRNGERDEDSHETLSNSSGHFGAAVTVGSPLRNSSLHPNEITSNPIGPGAVRSRPRSRDASPFSMHSPPPSSLERPVLTRSSGSSLLAQQFQKLRMQDPGLRPSPGRTPSGSSGVSGIDYITSREIANTAVPERGQFERTVSSSSGLGRSAHEKIDEEPEELCMFELEVEEKERREEERRRQEEEARSSEEVNRSSSEAPRSSVDSERKAEDSVQPQASAAKQARAPWNVVAGGGKKYNVAATTKGTGGGIANGGVQNVGVIGGGRGNGGGR